MLRRKGLLAANGQPQHPHSVGGHGNGSHNNNANNLSNNQQSLSFTNSLGLWNTDPNRSCGRCRSELGRIMNRGAFCRACNIRVCKSCREYGSGRNSGGASDWLCTICYKNR